VSSRYYLEIKIGDEMNELDFFMLDQVVVKAAPLTCIELQKKVEFLNCAFMFVL
jgi:hypothetical protein